MSKWLIATVVLTAILLVWSRRRRSRPTNQPTGLGSQMGSSKGSNTLTGVVLGQQYSISLRPLGLDWQKTVAEDLGAANIRFPDKICINEYPKIAERLLEVNQPERAMILTSSAVKIARDVAKQGQWFGPCSVRATNVFANALRAIAGSIDKGVESGLITHDIARAQFGILSLWGVEFLEFIDPHLKRYVTAAPDGREAAQQMVTLAVSLAGQVRALCEASLNVDGMKFAREMGARAAALVS
jgi:hypothetical protein